MGACDTYSDIQTHADTHAYLQTHTQRQRGANKHIHAIDTHLLYFLLLLLAALADSGVADVSRDHDHMIEAHEVNLRDHLPAEEIWGQEMVQGGARARGRGGERERGARQQGMGESEWESDKYMGDAKYKREGATHKKSKAKGEARTAQTSASLLVGGWT